MFGYSNFQFFKKQLWWKMVQFKIDNFCTFLELQGIFLPTLAPVSSFVGVVVAKCSSRSASLMEFHRK